MTKKKILIVRSAMGQGGADRITLTLLKHLDKERYDLSLLLMNRTGEFLSSVPEHVAILGPKSSNLWIFLPDLIRGILRTKADVVFSIDGGTNIPAAIAACLWPWRKWKLILSERNILFPPGKNKFKRTMMLAAKYIFYRCADALTAVSDGVQEDMHQRLKIKPEKIRIVDNPIIDGNLITLSRESLDHPWFKSDRTIPVVVHAGRFVYQKDHHTLLQAFARLTSRVPARLVLLGEGPLHHDIVREIETLKLSEAVQMVGFDINPFKYFSRCDLFVLSSVHEGMPGVLIQAMACGAPVVSTDCPSGPNEVIKPDWENGILVPVRDPEALSNAMYSVLTNQAMTAAFRSNGAQSVSRFEIHRAIQSYVNAIES